MICMAALAPKGIFEDEEPRELTGPLEKEPVRTPPRRAKRAEKPPVYAGSFYEAAARAAVPV